MNVDYLIYGSIGLGVLLLASNYVDLSYITSKIFFPKANDDKIVVVVPGVQNNKKDQFLQIVSLWFQLKEKCDQFNLTIASDKLDEVFPLLNGVLEDE